MISLLALLACESDNNLSVLNDNGNGSIDGIRYMILNRDITVSIKCLISKGCCEFFSCFVLNIANADGTALGNKALNCRRT